MENTYKYSKKNSFLIFFPQFLKRNKTGKNMLCYKTIILETILNF